MRRKSLSQDQIVEEVKSADLDVKMKLVREALNTANEHGNAEQLLRYVVRNADQDAKQAAAVEAVTSDTEVAEQVLGDAMTQVPLEIKRTAVKNVVESTDTQRDARQLITAAMNPAPDGKKVAVVRAVKNADSEAEAAELLTQALHAAPAGTAEAAIEDARLKPETLERIWITIVRTFAWVLVGATLGLVAIVILDIFYDVELAHVQIMLTMFTTVAGILAGFITGQAVGTARERAKS